MSQNARVVLGKWWEEQAKIARQPGTVSGATTVTAECRMAVINELRNWVNTEATLSDVLESAQFLSDPKTVPNNQVQAVWTSICAIAEAPHEPKSRSWTRRHFRSMRIQRLAATINTCKG